MNNVMPSGQPVSAPPRPVSHILVVDEDDAAGDRARDLLEHAGYDVTTADLPDIGLVRRVQPDVVVLGLMYRGQATGLDFVERHASDPMTASIPVVVHASVAELSDAQRMRLAALPYRIVSTSTPAGELLAELDRVLALPV
jgi:CheY-like chemotaxis protein